MENIEEVGEKLVIDVYRLDREGETLEGEVECVDVHEEFVDAFGGVRYRLNARVFGTELLVRGTLEQDFSYVCSRCGKDFDDTVKVGDFTASFEINDKSPDVDLTNEIRESIILALPTFPVCSETCPGVVQKTKTFTDDRWNVLERLRMESRQPEDQVDQGASGSAEKRS
jgi:uncharacterized metal-binding protein YceD (DUF177 family)